MNTLRHPAGLAGRCGAALILTLAVAACGSSPSTGSGRGGASGSGGRATGGAGTGGVGSGGIGTGGSATGGAGTGGAGTGGAGTGGAGTGGVGSGGTGSGGSGSGGSATGGVGSGGRGSGGVGSGGAGRGGGGSGGASAGGSGVGDAGTGPTDASRPALCSLPFEAGNCLAAFRVFTAGADGVCVPAIYGGCGGNDNRFTTLEQCMATCEGRPNPGACPTDRIAKRICVACGPAGGCGQELEVCAQPCPGPTACPPALASCTAGVCQAGGCI